MMYSTLLLALVIVSAIALGFAYCHGRDLFGAIKARRALRQATAERDAAKTDHKKTAAECVRLAALLGTTTADKLAALARVGTQAESIKSMDADIRQHRETIFKRNAELDTARDVNSVLLAAQASFEREIQALTLRVETVTKEAQEKQRTAAILQATSNERIDELAAKVKGFKAYAASV
jgi:predicted RNase H-like nuclease (RuvC/YqgF family)